MKNVLIVTLLLAGSTVFACPNLSGHFICKDFDNGSQQDVVMTQSVVNGVTKYTMTLTADGKTNSSDYLADGVVRNIEHPNYTVRTQKSTCNGANLVTEINGTRKDNGEVLKVVELVTLTKDGHMYDSYIGKQGDKDIKFEETCQRVN